MRGKDAVTNFPESELCEGKDRDSVERRLLAAPAGAPVLCQVYCLQCASRSASTYLDVYHVHTPSDNDLNMWAVHAAADGGQATEGAGSPNHASAQPLSNAVPPTTQDQVN